MSYIFGPVLSRRLGRSLGIDLMVPKTCSMDCIYCECGTTNELTLERKNDIPIQEVIVALDAYLLENPNIDYITFSGSGEPTLHAEIGTLVHHIQTHYPQYKICLLTNSTLLHLPEVRAALKGIDRIVPSLDGANMRALEAVTHLAKGVDVQQIIEGIAAFRRESPETFMALEIFIIPELNDTAEDMEDFKRAVAYIKPHCVQLNSLDRPGCVDWIQIPSEACINRFMEALLPLCPTELIGKIDFSKIKTQISDLSNLSNRLLGTCARRPCTVKDLCALTGLGPELILSQLQTLQLAGRIAKSELEGEAFYVTKM